MNNLKTKETIMVAKTLEKGSKYAQFDVDGDGIVTDDEMQKAEAMIKMENEDMKQDAQRRMAWAAMLAMIAYPLLLLIPIIPDARIVTLASISDMLFLSLSGVVAFFFGSQAYMSKNGSSNG